MQRLLLNASRKAGFSATVSLRALMSRAPIEASFAHEGMNADLRHYLTRLVRRSRCFSRCIHALGRAVDLFVRCYNARQLRKRK